ncbi:hypothetical protein Fmac_015034 [Flemingia macrophylla]|uniref:Transmembrane protein n=1 Tax=Flemingia macrophylla TaxID=520843 RepID=A0ABD1MDF3_9FABA
MAVVCCVDVDVDVNLCYCGVMLVVCEKFVFCCGMGKLGCILRSGMVGALMCCCGACIGAVGLVNWCYYSCIKVSYYCLPSIANSLS